MLQNTIIVVFLSWNLWNMEFMGFFRKLDSGVAIRFLEGVGNYTRIEVVKNNDFGGSLNDCASW